MKKNFLQLARANVCPRYVPSANLKRKNSVPSLPLAPVTFRHNRLSGLTVCEPRDALRPRRFFDAPQDRKDHPRHVVAVRLLNEFDLDRQEKYPNYRPA